MLKNILFVCVFVLSLPGMAWAAYYQYRDESGRLVFTDDISRIPAGLRDDARWVPGVRDFSFLQEELEAPETPVVVENGPEQARAVLEKENVDISTRKQKVEETFNELRSLHQSLMDKRKVLDVNNPEALALFNTEVAAYDNAMNAYDKELDALNKKVVEYNKRVASFDSRQKTAAEISEKEESGTKDSFWDDASNDQVDDFSSDR